MYRFLKLLGLWLFLSAHTICAYAGELQPEKISSICARSDINKINCEDVRDCAFKTEAVISDFLAKYETPNITKHYALKYPRKCLHRSYQKETVNMVFEVQEDGAAINVRVISSSNNCFDKAARNYLRHQKFAKSKNGFICIPATLTYMRKPLVDASGNRY